MNKVAQRPTHTHRTDLKPPSADNNSYYGNQLGKPGEASPHTKPPSAGNNSYYGIHFWRPGEGQPQASDITQSCASDRCAVRWKLLSRMCW